MQMKTTQDLVSAQIAAMARWYRNEQERMAAIWFPGHTQTPSATVAAMATEGSITQLEDQINVFFQNTDREFRLMVLRYLRIDMPHQSTQLADLEREILTERRKKKIQEVTP